MRIGRQGNNTVTHSDNTAKSVDTLKAVWKPVNTAEEKIVFVVGRTGRLYFPLSNKACRTWGIVLVTSGDDKKGY